MNERSWGVRPGSATLRGALAWIAAGLIALSASAQAPTTAPRFVYGPGPQGYIYYPAQRAAQPQRQVGGAAAVAAPAPAAANRPRTVGPGARNWATGNRVSVHRPWMQARN